MAKIPNTAFPRVPVRYPAIILDNAYGTTQQVLLKRTQGVIEYNVSVVEGTLSGGTSPAWTVDMGNPIVSKFQIEADNTVIHSYDAYMAEEYEKLTSGRIPDGLSFILKMVDVDYHSKGRDIETTLFPSYAFSQSFLNLTIPALSTLTSGSPTSSSGTTLYVTEYSVPRSLINFKPLLVKKLESSVALSQTGDNNQYTLLPQTGAYKALLFFINTGSSQKFSSGSNSVVDYFTLRLNDVITDTDAYTSALRSANNALFGVQLDTGFFMRVYMDDDETSKLLALGNTQAITGIDLNLHTTTTGFATVLKIIYA